MGRADVSLKNFFADRKRYADLFNGALFDGKDVIKSEDLEIVNNESSVIFPDSMGKKRTVTRFGDIRMRWKKEVILAVLTTEFQDEVHYAMPVKNMMLESLCYIDQMRDIWNNISESDMVKELRTAELFSRFRRNDKLFPVISIVFYYGDEWDGSTCLYDMFKFSSESLTKDNLDVFSKYVTNYKINLFNPRDISDYTVFKTDLQIIFSMLQYKEDKDAMRRYIHNNAGYFSSMTLEAAEATGTLLHSYSWFDRTIDKLKSKKKEECDMCKAIDDMINEGVEKGIEIGMKKGIEKGIEKGISALIESCREFNMTREKTVAQVKKKFALTDIKAEALVEKYW